MIREIPQSTLLKKSKETLETHKEFIKSITENDAEEEWIELENSEEDSEDDFEYEELKR